MDDLEGVWPPFRRAVEGLLSEAGPRVWINSAFRSVAEQTILWNQAVAGYGSVEAARVWVAPPGSSNHGPKLWPDGRCCDGPYGRAVDFGGDLTIVHALASKYHIHQAMPWEGWHFEPDQYLYDHPDYGLMTPEEVHFVNEVLDPICSVTRFVNGVPAGGWEASKHGHVYTFGGAPYYRGWPDDADPGNNGRSDCVALVPTTTGFGYWLVSAKGECYGYGDAADHWPGNYRPDLWGDYPIVGAYTNARGNHGPDAPLLPVGGVTLIRIDTNTYSLPV